MDKAGGAKYQDDPNYLQTAGRTLEVLQLFLEGESLSLTAVARRMELSSTVVYRLLYTLTAHGFLIQDEDKSYRVGPALVSAGLRGLQAHKARAVASRYMWEFFRQSGGPGTMTPGRDMRSVGVERFRSIQDQNDTPFVGHSYPLHAGASHRILLAFLDRERQEAYLQDLFMDERTREDLRRELARIRERGYDYTEQAITKDVWGMSVPLFDSRGICVAGLSIGGYLSEMTPEVFRDRLRMLRQLARQINRARGARVRCLVYPRAEPGRPLCGGAGLLKSGGRLLPRSAFWAPQVMPPEEYPGCRAPAVGPRSAPAGRTGRHPELRPPAAGGAGPPQSPRSPYPPAGRR